MLYARHPNKTCIKIFSAKARSAIRNRLLVVWTLTADRGGSLRAALRGRCVLRIAPRRGDAPVRLQPGANRRIGSSGSASAPVGAQQDSSSRTTPVGQPIRRGVPYNGRSSVGSSPFPVMGSSCTRRPLRTCSNAIRPEGKASPTELDDLPGGNTCTAPDATAGDPPPERTS